MIFDYCFQIILLLKKFNFVKNNLSVLFFKIKIFNHRKFWLLKELDREKIITKFKNKQCVFNSNW